jgi:hypothetical protein
MKKDHNSQDNSAPAELVAEADTVVDGEHNHQNKDTATGVKAQEGQTENKDTNNSDGFAAEEAAEARSREKNGESLNGAEAVNAAQAANSQSAEIAWSVPTELPDLRNIRSPIAVLIETRTTG